MLYGLRVVHAARCLQPNCSRLYEFYIATMPQLAEVINTLYNQYQKSTPRRLKLIDAYLCYILITGVLQFVYGVVFGTFPFNAFISGFISTVASFVLAVCLRIQVNPENHDQFSSISPERAYGDFIFAHVILHLVVANFLG